MSVSAPFIFMSSQVGSTQVPAMQLSLAQSPSSTHAWPTSQPLQSGPPQSRSVSPPFKIMSSHAAGTQVTSQFFETQSSGTLHMRSSAQGGHEPPQSRSLSSPFASPSSQVGCGVQTPASQSPLVQSPSTPHMNPSSQGVHEPPQSRSLSSPFIIPSSHAGCAAVELPLELPVELPSEVAVSVIIVELPVTVVESVVVDVGSVDEVVFSDVTPFDVVLDSPPVEEDSESVVVFGAGLQAGRTRGSRLSARR